MAEITSRIRIVNCNTSWRRNWEENDREDAIVNLIIDLYPVYFRVNLFIMFRRFDLEPQPAAVSSSEFQAIWANYQTFREVDLGKNIILRFKTQIWYLEIRMYVIMFVTLGIHG